MSTELTPDERTRLRLAAFGIPEPQPHDEHLIELVEALLYEARSAADAAEENRISLANHLTHAENAYGVELDRRLAAERALTAVVEVVEAYESCGPKQQSTRDVLAAVRAAFECAALHGLDGCSQAPARALRDAALFFEQEMAQSWGGDAQWLTTGRHVAGVVADVLREEAADLDAERVAGVRRELAEFQYNALEMARKAEQAERRAEEAEFHVEQLRDARDAAERRIERACEVLDGWEHDGPEDPAIHLLIQRVREALDGSRTGEEPCPTCGGSMRFCECMDDPFARAPDEDCDHEWLDRPESDTRECLICGMKVAG